MGCASIQSNTLIYQAYEEIKVEHLFDIYDKKETRSFSKE